jgi:hypothetical protein
MGGPTGSNRAPRTRPGAVDYPGEMRLDLLCQFDWSYETGSRLDAPGYELVSAYGTDEGLAYGEGHGRSTGQINGRVVWSNYPRRRSDGRMLPNVRGLIRTDDGAAILFELRGRTIFEGEQPGRQNLVGWFEAEDERYRWLNDVVCIAEGRIDDDGMCIRVYTGVDELDQ